jgi:hypothetical protein
MKGERKNNTRGGEESSVRKVFENLDIKFVFTSSCSSEIKKDIYILL